MRYPPKYVPNEHVITVVDMVNEVSYDEHDENDKQDGRDAQEQGSVETKFRVVGHN